MKNTNTNLTNTQKQVLKNKGIVKDYQTLFMFDTVPQNDIALNKDIIKAVRKTQSYKDAKFTCLTIEKIESHPEKVEGDIDGYLTVTLKFKSQRVLKTAYNRVVYTVIYYNNIGMIARYDKEYYTSTQPQTQPQTQAQPQTQPQPLINYIENPNNTDNLTNLAKFIANSVVKKIRVKSGNTPFINKLFIELNKGVKDGQIIGDGYDLIQQATTLILEYSCKYGTDLLKPITIDRLKSKIVVVNANDIKPCTYEKIQTTPLREIYKGISRYIYAQKKQVLNSGKYLYIASQTLKGDKYYYRLNGADTIIGYDNLNSNEQIATADINALLSKLNLTARQTEIIRLKADGLTLTQIASILEIKPATVQAQITTIRKKSEGLFDIFNA